ncbi:hypothetical protein OGATHE_003893 [Ogataea polymorpha]|uniref:Uncharacterized protein n=1 Tax=Ogataea polymorpha TaxID=460523 RepID=A0A9P8P3B5_9ASCO|nr:hypothetical protein OGATHE_003893 [Ogataea polymorpha]
MMSEEWTSPLLWWLRRASWELRSWPSSDEVNGIGEEPYLCLEPWVWEGRAESSLEGAIKRGDEGTGCLWVCEAESGTVDWWESCTGEVCGEDIGGRKKEF